ncbi:DUF3426 domain-containing protein [Thermomonas fusca]|uniref:DUF3426 domain-containing protein n=1 Tax=Thermomonas fusca TaxID=215690 RepID=UPI0003FBC830|nr:DUF3426 domain-containing protein [Thermomonas fusca]
MSRAPSFVLAGSATANRQRGEWLAAAALALVLLAQLGWLQRERLAASTQLRPLLEATCGALGCTLPAWHEPAAFALLSRDVIAPPERPGVLRVQASFRNDAHWPQPWPALRLTLSDLNGRTLGTRRFQPADYLPTGTARSARIAPGQASQIAFDIVEPAPGVVGFDFRFE